jgi:hypothetical protein
MPREISEQGADEQQRHMVHSKLSIYINRAGAKINKMGHMFLTDPSISYN